MKYEIKGGEMPVVICYLEKNESMITEKGAMAWMTPNMEMDTQAGGGLGKALGRMFSGESIFKNIYTCRGGEGHIAFASSFPGSIVAVEITPDHPIIVQKSAFLASTPGVDLSVYFQKKFGTGMFGGEGFIMQKLSGSGLVFLEIDGSAIEYNLAAGQQLVIDTGNLAMMEGSCTMDLQSIKGAKNIFFGGEGIFNTVVTGPGKVTLQTMPMANLVGLIASHIPTSNN